MGVMAPIKATKNPEAGAMPSANLVEALGNYDRKLLKTGVMVSYVGIKPSPNGKPVAVGEPNRTVTDGPIAETRELVVGFWLGEVKDKAEAVEWLKRSPNPSLSPNQIQLRPLFEASNFADAPDTQFNRVGKRHLIHWPTTNGNPVLPQ